MFSGSKPKNCVYTVELKTKVFTSNIHLLAGYFGGHVAKTVNCAFYLWLLDRLKAILTT